jgi:thiol-disulfide isomerase/thioredoxin
MDRMMDGMMWPMWAMWLSWLLAVLVLVAVAFDKYLLSSNRKMNVTRSDRADMDLAMTIPSFGREASPTMMGRRQIRLVCLVAAAMLAAQVLGSIALAAEQAPANFIIHPAAKAVPDITFADERGHSVGLKDFRGKLVLLNVWATWCGPCRKEMPTLDRLQAALGSERFQVVALSIDRGGAASVQKFYAETGVRHLAFFIDSTGRAGSTLGLIGLPGTLLIDPPEREIGRLIGPAEWDSPEMIAFLESQIARHGARRANTLPPPERSTELMQ